MTFDQFLDNYLGVEAKASFLKYLIAIPHKVKKFQHVIFHSFSLWQARLFLSEKNRFSLMFLLYTIQKTRYFLSSFGATSPEHYGYLIN